MSDVPSAIVGGGAVNPLMPAPYFVQGSLFHTTIATYVSPTEVTLTDAPVTSIFNAGFYTIIVYRRCLFASDVASGATPFQFSASIAPGTRDTLQFSVFNSLGGSLGPSNPYIERFTLLALGQPVYLRSTDSAVGEIFGGQIDTLTVSSYPGVPDIAYCWSATCVSWAGLAMRRCVPPNIPQVLTNVDGYEAFTRIVLDYLENDSVAVSGSFASPPFVPTITLACPVGASVSQLLDQIVSSISTPDTAWYWYTDPWRTYVLAMRTATDAPWDVTTGEDLFAGSTPYQQSLVSTHNQMANEVFAVGQNVLLNLLPVTFTGDGSTTAFNLPAPCGAAPAIKLNGGAQTVGILGVDAGKNWYWAQGSSVITQDSGGTVLTSSDTLVVSFTSETPGVAQAPNVASLQGLQGIEGTSANYSHALTVTAPILPSDLLALATGYATEYGLPAVTAQLYTLRPGLAVGQLQSIDLPEAGIPSGSYLIATVQMTTSSNVIVWQYTAFGGANIGNAITALTQFINRGQVPGSIVTPVVPITLGLHEITVDHTKVSGGADITNFIFGFVGTYSWLAGPPNGDVAYADGADIYFSTDAEGAEVMAFDLEYYDPTTGQIAAWVLIPTLSHTTDTVLYIQYGNPSNNTSKATPFEVWSAAPEVSGVPNANYRGVYHLSETSAPYEDSTKYGNDSTSSIGAGYPSRTAGPFAYAVDCPSSNKGISFTPGLSGNGFSNLTAYIECWVSTTYNGTPIGHFLDVWDAYVTDVTGSNFGIAILIYSDGTAIGRLSVNGVFTTISSGVVVNDGAWHHIAFVSTSSGAALYVDGSPAGTSATGQNEPYNDVNPVVLNGPRNNIVYEFYQGLVAEPKVSQYAIGAGQIATNWANQNSPSTFYSIGPSQSGPPPQTVPVPGNPQGTVSHTTGPLTLGEPVIGNGAGDVKAGTKTGSTTQVQMASGSAGAAGAPLLYDASGNAVAGVTGQLVPSGGTAGEVLTKNSGTNYDVSWQSNDDDIQINGATSLNVIKVNGTQVWIGQTEIQFNGTFI